MDLVVDFDRAIAQIKTNLTKLLADMGGRAEVTKFGAAYMQRHGVINLKLTELLKNFSDDFTVSFACGSLWVERLKIKVPSSKQAKQKPQTSPPPEASNVKTAGLLNQFLSDCSTNLEGTEKETNYKLWSSNEGNDDDPIKKFKDNNPFLNCDTTETVDIQPELFLSIDEGTASLKFKPQPSDVKRSFFEFNQITDDLIVGEYPDNENEKLLLIEDKDDRSSSTEYQCLESKTSSKSSEYKAVLDVSAILSEKAGSFKSALSSDEPEAYLEDLIQTDEDTAIENSALIPADELDEIFETLEFLRENDDNGVSLFDRIQCDSLERLSSVDYDVNAENDEETLMGNPLLIEELGAGLPYDAPMYYSHYPPHNRDPDYELPTLEIKSHIKGEVIYISEANSPTHFWFQFKSAYIDFLKRMQRKLYETYTKFFGDKDLRISVTNRKVGLIVAAFHPVFKEWYRARISENRKNGVFVFFLDYGTHCYLNKKYVRYLLKDFLIYPKGCERARIFNVVPYGGENIFTIKQMGMFIKKLYDRDMIADVMNYDENQQIYELQIKLRNPNEDLNEWLKSEKICESMPEDVFQTRNNKDDGALCYMRYTHEMLEMGAYPSYDKLFGYKEKGIDFKL